MLALLIVTLVVSLVTIVFGELVPKTLALAHAERYALVAGAPGRARSDALLAPVVWLLDDHHPRRDPRCSGSRA